MHIATHRHALKFEHNTLTGKRVLWLDGTRIHKVASKFELTGKIKFELGSATVTIAIDSAAYGKLDYTLLVDGKVIKDVRESTQTCKAARWEVYGKKGYIYDVEFGACARKHSYVPLLIVLFRNHRHRDLPRLRQRQADGRCW